FFKNKLFNNMLFSLTTVDYSLCTYSPIILAQIYFYYAQALGCLNKYDEMIVFATKSISIFRSLGFYKNAQLLIEALKTDFDTIIT
ncbi:hypothetical protein, partial [Butyrivibrio sp. VCB2006]